MININIGIHGNKLKLKIIIISAIYIHLKTQLKREPEQARTWRNSPPDCFAESGTSRLNEPA